MLVSVFAVLLSVVLACSAFAAAMPYDSMKMVKNMGGYLYEAKYQPTTDENYATLNAVCEQLFGITPPPFPGCTSVRKGNLYGRNFDFFCDKYADIIVRTPAGNGRYASIMLDGGMLGRTLGTTVAQSFPGEFCTKARLDAIISGSTPLDLGGGISEGLWLTLLPYVAMDGINEKGVVCNINVAQSRGGVESTKSTNPGGIRMYVALCPRYILDFCASAKEAVEKLSEFDIWAAGDIPLTEYHIMVADAKNTYVIEFKNNKMLAREISNKPYMTNFNLLLDDSKTVSFDIKGCVVRNTIINYDGTLGDRGNGHGVDRYDTVAKGYASVTDKKTMRDLLDVASYGQLYYYPIARFDELVAGDIRESELCNLSRSIYAATGDDRFIVNEQMPGVFSGVFVDDMKTLTLGRATAEAAKLCEYYNLGTLLPQVAAAADADRTNIMPIHTIHSCIYDIPAGKVWIKSQELGSKAAGAWSNEYSISVKEDSSSGGCNAGFGALALLALVSLALRGTKNAERRTKN